MYIPDPIERMEDSIERQMELVDANGNYPCIGCGTPTPLDDLITLDASPAAPACCPKCFDEMYGEMLK